MPGIRTKAYVKEQKIIVEPDFNANISVPSHSLRFWRMIVAGSSILDPRSYKCYAWSFDSVEILYLGDFTERA